MGICWHCHWGWPKPVMDLYDKAVEKLNGKSSVLHFGPSHIVWEDENWEDKHIESCIEAEKESKYNWLDRYSQEELDICIWSLNELLKIPYKQRDYEPEDYDNEHPENYPPPKDVIMVRR